MSDVTPPPSAGFGRRMLANSGQAAFGRVLVLGVWTLMVPVLLHGLGPEAFALWALFSSLTGYLTALDFGFAQGTLRHVAAARARGEGREAGEFALVGMLGYLVLGAVWFAITPLARGPVIELLRIAPAQHELAGTLFMLGPVAFACMGLSMVTVTALQGWGRFDLANAVTVSSVVVQVAGAILAIRHGAGLVGVIAFAILGTVVATLVGLVMLRIGAPGFAWGTWRGAVTRIREVVAFGGPLQIGNVLAVAHQQVDKVLLSRYVALIQVAPYELGLRAATVMGSLPQIVLTALISEASALHAMGDQAGLRAAHDRAARWVMTFTAMLAAALMVGSGRLLAAWLGDVPAGSDFAVVGLSVAMVLAMSTGVVAAMARAFGRTRYEAEYSALAFVLHTALGLWLVPRHGLDGAIRATLAANVVAVAWYLWRFARFTGWPLRALVAPSVPPLVALGLVAVAGRTLAGQLPHSSGLLGWLWVVVAAGVPPLVVLALLSAVGFVTPGEWRALLGRARSIAR